MKRREFLTLAAAAGASLWLHQGTAFARVGAFSSALSPGHRAARAADNLLILVELKGGNDGLNTVVPFSDPLYYRYRPHIAVRRHEAIALDERVGLNPALAPLLPIWCARELAIVQGVGCPQPNLSHYRASEIWDTASRSDRYLRDGWLARAFSQAPADFGKRALVYGSAELGPFASGAGDAATTVEAFGTFGDSVKAAMHALALADAGSASGVPVIRLTLNGFDTHGNQPLRHAGLLHQFATGMSAMREALVALGRWNRTLIVAYSEFGRSARENALHGTDHGTAAPCFVAGGRVAGGLYGPAPQLTQLDGNGNLPFAIDFRRLHATVLRSWWGLDAEAVLQGRFRPLPILRA